MEEAEMEHTSEKWACTHCGFAPSGEFNADLCPECGMPFWKCAKCGFLITASIPPDVCPECGEKCDFINVTCYVPDCGGPDNIDPRM